MKDKTQNAVKSFAYKLGQAFATVIVSCGMVLVICFTLAVAIKLFQLIVGV